MPDAGLLLDELVNALHAVATLRLRPYGRTLKPRTLYRPLYIKHFRGSSDQNIGGRLVHWGGYNVRNARSVHDISDVMQTFYRHASIEFSLGEFPAKALSTFWQMQSCNQDPQALHR